MAKKTQNEELLDWVEPYWFRHTFVTMYMAFVSQTSNPWEVPTKQSINIMLKIWDATSRHKYEIMTLTAIYQKVG